MCIYTALKTVVCANKITAKSVSECYIDRHNYICTPKCIATQNILKSGIITFKFLLIN